MGDPEVLVSDAEREHAVAWLQDHLLAGRLTLEEFSQRVECAYSATVHADLEQIRAGLPSAQGQRAVGYRRRTTRFTAALFSRVIKRGRLKLGGWPVAGGVFCDLDLDLRQAEVQGRRTLLTVLLGFGNVDVYVPESVKVSVSGVTLGGHRREWGEDAELPHSPEISVRVIALFGTVDVWRVPADLAGDYGDIFHLLRARQGELPP